MAMEFRKKKYHSVLNFHQLESAIDKKILNIRLVDELRAVMCDLSGKEKFLHLYWYNLKYYVHSLHAAYRLLHKILYIYGDNQICKKHKNHNMIYGPRPVAENITLHITDHIHYTKVSFHRINFKIQVEFKNT